MYHVTTTKKLKRYEQSGCILPPVRFWSSLYSAKKWQAKTQRTIILKIHPSVYYPLPIKGGAYWTDEIIRKWRRVI